MEAVLKSKTLYKILLGLLKVLPAFTALIYFVNSMLSLCGIEVIFLSILGGQSITSLLFILIASYVFKFCSYHRIFIYYIMIIDLLNYIDYYIGIPISTDYFIIVISLLTAIFLFLSLYLHLKSKRNETNSKESITSDD